MSRSYCFTLNNYTVNELEEIYKSLGIFRYFICGAEKGEKGTPHLQGYFELEKPQRISYFKKTGLRRAHLEKRAGTREQAKAYCEKDKDTFEYGIWEAGGQGARNDLKKVMEMIKNEKPMLEIFEEAPEIASRNLRFIDRYVSLLERETTKEFRKVDVEVLVGDAGTGKTKRAFEYDPNIFTVDADEAFPFDGYNGEKTILIDDFYGGIKHSKLLRVLDGHQYKVNVKGGCRWAKWTKVFITSNKGPTEWYQRGLSEALKRRLTTVTWFRNEEAKGNTEPWPNHLDDNVE